MRILDGALDRATAQALRAARTISDAYDWPDGRLDVFLTDASTDTQVGLRWAPGDELIVAVPGTASLRDWSTNRRLWPRSVDGIPGRWHCGYAAAALAVVDEVEDILRDEKPARVLLAGHSLGGAVAGILGAILIDRGVLRPGRCNLHSFGAPRFAGREAAAFLSEWWGPRAWRWRLEVDVVPLAVPGLLGYRHVGIPVFVGANGTLRTSRSIREWWAEVVAAWRTPGLDLTGDHGVGRYVQWLEGRARS